MSLCTFAHGENQTCEGRWTAADVGLVMSPLRAIPQVTRRMHARCKPHVFSNPITQDVCGRPAHPPILTNIRHDDSIAAPMRAVVPTPPTQHRPPTIHRPPTTAHHIYMHACMHPTATQDGPPDACMHPPSGHRAAPGTAPARYSMVCPTLSEPCL